MDEEIMDMIKPKKETKIEKEAPKDKSYREGVVKRVKSKFLKSSPCLNLILKS